MKTGRPTTIIASLSLVLLFTFFPGYNSAQFLHNSLSLNSGVTLPHGFWPISGKGNIIMPGTLGGIHSGTQFKISNLLSVHAGLGISYTSLPKNKYVIDHDCTIDSHITYVSPDDSIKGRGQRFWNMQATIGIQVSLLRDQLFLRIGAGLEYIVSSQVETYPARCLPGATFYIPYIPDNSVDYRRGVAIIEAAFGGRIGLSTGRFRPFWETYSQIGLQSHITVFNSSASSQFFSLRTTQIGIRVGVYFQ